MLITYSDVSTPNLNGDFCFSPNHRDPTEPNEKYFSYVDKVMDKIEDYGFYNALWVVWGSTFISRGGGTQPKMPFFFTPESSYVYGKYVGNRYGNRSNIIWVLGGDIAEPVDPADHLACYRAMAEGIAQGISGSSVRPRWNDKTNPIWKKQMMTLHATSPFSSSEVFGDDAWLRFNLIQSGWRRYDHILPLIHTDYLLPNTKPTFMGEGAYEYDIYTYCNMPGNNDQWGVRFNAYWSVLAGGFGTTYGANHLYQFDDQWKVALKYPGSGQVQYLRDLMEAHQWTKLVPDFKNMFVPQSENKGNVTDCALVIGAKAYDGSFGFVYDTKGIPFGVDMGQLSGVASFASWMDPRTGQHTPIGRFTNSGIRTFTPGGIPGNENDWLLVLDTTK